MIKNVFFLLTLFLLCSCSEKTSIARFNLTSEVDSLDPARAYDSVSSTLVYSIYETLFEYHYLKRPYTLKPLLAEAMPTLSADRKTYTIKIKKNVLYHPNPCFKGKERFVQAQDFINQIKRVAFKPVKSKGWWTVDKKIEGVNEFREKVAEDYQLFLKESISGLQAPDQHTLVIKLTQPSPQIIQFLSLAFFSPLPLEAIEYYKNDFSTQTVGTGAFFIAEHKPESYYLLKKFTDYRQETYPLNGDRFSHDKNLLADAGKSIPFLDEVHLSISRESKLSWQKFLNKKLDAFPIDQAHYDEVFSETGKLKKELKKQGVQVESYPNLAAWWIGINMQHPILGKNKNVRLAIAHALNIPDYVRKFTRNMGQVANSIYIPGILGYSPSKKFSYAYNPEKALEYLQKAGYPEGKGLPTFIFDTRRSSQLDIEQAKYIQAQLLLVGIKVKIVVNTFPEYLKKAYSQKLQLWQDGWALDYPEAENILQLLSTQSFPPGPNKTYYSNPEFDDLYSQLLITSDSTQKLELINRMETIIDNDQPWIMQYYDRRYVVSHKQLKNYRYSNLIYGLFKYLKVTP